MGLSLISLIGYFYTLVLAVLSYFCPLSDTVKSLIAQPGLVLIPYLIGKPVLFIARRLLSIKEEGDFIIDLLVTWSLGIIFIVALEAILYVSYAFSLDAFTLILLLIGIPSIFIKEKASFATLKHKELAIAAVYGFFFSLFVTCFWNYPYANDTDYINHTFYVTRIVIQNRPLFFYTDYMPAMHTLYAILVKLFSIDIQDAPLFLLWSSRFILYPIYAVGLYLFAYQFSKNKLVGLLSAIIGSSLVYHIDGSLFPFHTAPKNFINIVFIYGLYASLRLYHEQGEKTKRGVLAPLFILAGLILIIFVLLYLTSETGVIGYEIGFILPFVILLILVLPVVVSSKQRGLVFSMALLSAGLIFMHKLMGLAASGILLAFLFLIWLLRALSLRKARILVFCLMVAALLAFILFQFEVIPYPHTPIFAPETPGEQFMFGPGKLLMYLGSVYPAILFFFFIAGCLFPLLVTAEENRELLIVVTLASITILLYFLPLTGSFRFLGFAHPFIIFLSVFAIFSLLRMRPLSLRKTFASLPFILTIGLVLAVIFLHDIQEFPNSITGEAQKRWQLFEIGDYIKHNVVKDATIVCYQMYDRLAASYGGVDRVSSWAEGQYTDGLISEIYLTKTAREAYERLKALLNNRELFVRYLDVGRKDLERFYKSPSELILLYGDVTAGWLGEENSTEKFFDPRYFELLFTCKNESRERFFVFRVKPKSGSDGYENLVKNPSFEEGWDDSEAAPYGWKRMSPHWEGSLDKDIKSGGCSFKMGTSPLQGEAWGGLMSEEIDVEAGETYLVELSIKMDNANDSHLKLGYLDKEKGEYVNIAFITDVAGTQDWERRSKFVGIPQGVSRVNVMLMAGGVKDESLGDAVTWFDDIEMIGPIDMGER